MYTHVHTCILTHTCTHARGRLEGNLNEGAGGARVYIWYKKSSGANAYVPIRFFLTLSLQMRMCMCLFGCF